MASHNSPVANGSRSLTSSASFSSTSVPAAAGAYVYPRPVLPLPRSSTTTIVVESHSAVPSDSGSSVGTVKAETSRASTAACLPRRIAVALTVPE
jgi:hypothetical protein